MDDKKLIQFYTSFEDKEKLRLLAKLDGRTISGYLRNLIKITILRGERDGLIKR